MKGEYAVVRRWISGIAALALLAFACPVAAAPGPGAPGLGSPPGRLSRHDQALLAAARAAGQSEVTLLVAAGPGAEATLAQRIAALGGSVGFQDATLGYLRVRVATGKAAAIAGLPGVAAVSLDEVLPLDDPRPEAVAPAAGSGPQAPTPPGPNTPPVNPYLPAGEIGAPQFVQAHPTYDGRGVVIGLLDTGVDLLTPELQTARRLDGAPVRKIIDWVTYTDPVNDDDPTWIDMQEAVRAVQGGFVYQGVTYTAPHDGTFRIGRFDERDPRLGGELAGDVNRDGNPLGSSGLFAVLWEPDADLVWVDANQDHDFTDEPAMTNYREHYDVGRFGHDDPATPLRESVPFVVQTDHEHMYVNIGIVSAAHGTHVAGIAAGKGFFGGAMSGVAPEAQIVSIRVCLFVTGCTAHALIEGMIYAVQRAHVDVINMSIGGLPALNDGNSARSLLYNRLIDRYGVQMFISAGNSGPGINTVGDPSVAARVVSVGAYVSKDTWYLNYGALADKADGLFVFSSRGPAEDGGFKPNLVAPGSAVSCIPAWEQNAPLVGPLPPGYDMYNGTSMAAPEATGAGALLISAARQAHVPYTADRLRQALHSSARFLTGYGAHEQGNGLLQVGAAWEVLRQKVQPVSITSAAPVGTVLAGYLASPYLGPGIYEREGWQPGASGQRTILFTRLTGPNRPITYNLSWVGNDGTFAAAVTSIRLELGMPVPVQVTVHPAAAGAHSAILNLDDPATPGIDYQTLNTVVAAADLKAAGGFTMTASGQADRPDKTTFFFRVPADTPALKLDLDHVQGRVRLLTFDPQGLPNDSAGYQTGGSQLRAVSNPLPGVWEATVDTSRASALSPASFGLQATLLGADISPAAWSLDQATLGATATQEFHFTNRLGAFSGGAVGSPLGSARVDRPSIGTNDLQVFDIHVTPGSTAIAARIGGAADPAADLDLYLYDCTAGACSLAAVSAGSTASEAVSVPDPAAGTWKALVVGYDVPSGSTAYDYQDVFVNPAFGSVTVGDGTAARESGTTWSASASVAPGAAPESGRFLQGLVQVVADGSVVIGRAEVDVQSVS